MTETSTGRRSGVRVVFRVGRRTIADSLYLLTAPVTAVAGLLVLLAALGVAAVGWLTPGRPAVPARGLAPVRWLAAAERWRIGKIRHWPTHTPRPRRRGEAADAAGWSGSSGEAADVADPGLWLSAAHAVVVLPVALVTSTVTALWWFVGLGAATSALRGAPWPAAGEMRPMTLTVGGAESHIALSLGLTSPIERLAFGTAAGLALLCALPLVTRACVAVQAGLGRALLSDASPLHRRISGLEHERDTARAQTVAAVTAEAAALRRLERDIHDGPQQRLVRLALELGRAQHNFDTRPELVRTALADALVQTEEALDELRALSRGIAPPILVDRGLHAALSALAARSTVPVEFDTDPLGRRLDAAVEAAAYFVIAEAMTNVAKHSYAGRCAIGLRHSGGSLRVWVTDDGVGGAAVSKGHGLRGLEERLQAAGGRLLVTSPYDGPTTITAELPCC